MLLRPCHQLWRCPGQCRRHRPHHKTTRKNRRKWRRPDARTSLLALSRLQFHPTSHSSRRQDLRLCLIRRVRMSQPPLTRATSPANTAARPSCPPTRSTGTRRIARNVLRRAEVWILGHKVVLWFTVGEWPTSPMFWRGFGKTWFLVVVTSPFFRERTCVQPFNGRVR